MSYKLLRQFSSLFLADNVLAIIIKFYLLILFF